MNKVYFLLVLWLTKLLIFLIRLFYLGQSSNFPGKIALIIKKDFLKGFKFKKNSKIILITGTNGKSTTCGLLASILKSAGKKVFYNRTGANLKSGIASACTKYSSMFGYLKYDFICLETDEATLPLITKEICADVIAVTNLFRDQLDRFGELDTAAKLIQEGINNNKNSKVLLNADDVRVAFLRINNKKVYYGMDKNMPLTGLYSDNLQFPEENKSWLSDPEEITTCPRCNSNLVFDCKTIAHLGTYKCLSCNLKKPVCSFLVQSFKADSLTMNFNLLHENQKFNLFLSLIGIFNLYNALCAIAVAKSVTDVTQVQIQKGLQSYLTIFGRGEKIHVKGKSAWIYLIKNPAGATEVLKTLSNFPNSRFLVALNDNFADGRDVSWIWDARFDYLKDHKKEIYVSGTRAHDMSLRLKYAGLNEKQLNVNDKIMLSITNALKNISSDETLYILPTYTVLLEIQKKGICKMLK